jgi:hypothetical protein
MHLKLAYAAALVVASSFAFLLPQDDKKPGGQDAPPTSEEMKAMMAGMLEAAKPGEPHKHLSAMVGKWTTTVKTSGMPGMPAEETKGAAVYRSILDGRQIVGDTTGTMMGMPFNGFMLLGYDNVTKEYVSTWTDNWSSGQYMTRGAADDAGKVVTMKGIIKDAMTPDGRPWALVIKIESKDKHVIEVLDTIAPGQPPQLVVTVTATRDA